MKTFINIQKTRIFRLVVTATILIVLPGVFSYGYGEAEKKREKTDQNLSSSSPRETREEDRPLDLENIFSGFSGSFCFNHPLNETRPYNEPGAGTQGEERTNFTLSASIRYNPVTYWFMKATFYKYLHSDYQAPWDPDFSYTFGYDDWHPNTFSLTYSNYGGNRLNPDRDKGETFTEFLQGTFSLEYKFTLDETMENWFIVHSTGGVSGSVHYNLTPEYMDLKSLEYKRYKHSLGITVKYSIYKEWYIEATAYFYPREEQKQPWDPDFTYGFGYFDWRPGTISLQYNNYSGNRFPWNDKNEGTGNFGDGSVSLCWSWEW